MARVTIAQDFAAAYRRGERSAPEPQMVPDRLAVAVTEVTGVDGVGLGVFDRLGLAVPIGASSDRTTLAERLQFTVGQGPCYDAHRYNRTIVAVEAEMARSWPAYYDLIMTQTSFRSVVALPLTGPLESMATIDLLFHDPQAAAHVPLGQIAVLGRQITAALIEADLMADADDVSAAGSAGADQGPVWLSSPSSVARNQVMVAAGMLNRYLEISTADALKVLKARAYANRSTTDQVAASLVAGVSSPADFQLDS